jgi:hypothetical protein
VQQQALTFLLPYREVRGVGAFHVLASFLVMCWRCLVCLLAPAATPSILTLLCLLDFGCALCFSCSTFKSSGFLVFAPLLLRGVDAFHAVASFLVMCWRELVCLLAPVATPFILTSLWWLLELIVHCVSASAHSNLGVLICFCVWTSGNAEDLLNGGNSDTSFYSRDFVS